MLVTCSECEKKVKVSDGAAGKKVRCPECGEFIAVPADQSVTTKRPSPSPQKTRRPAANDDDDYASEVPTKKSSAGLIVGLLGCGALALILMLALGGVGVWYLWLRDRPAAADPDGQANNDPRPAKDIQVKVLTPRVDRFGDQIQMTVQYEVTDAKADSSVGLFMVFPSDPGNPQMVKLVGAQELQNKPNGTWSSARFTPDPNLRGDNVCEIVVRSPDGGGDFKNGKELAKLAGVVIPPIPADPMTVLLAKIVVKQNAEFSRMIDFSFDCVVNRVRPGVTLWFEAEFIDPENGRRQRVPLANRTGADIKPIETISTSVVNPFATAKLCDILVSDNQPGTGNLMTARDVKVEPVAGPVTVVLGNAQVERVATPLNQCKVSVDVQVTSGKPTGNAYRTAVIFKVKGVNRAPMDFGNILTPAQLTAGVTGQTGQIGIPANADPECDIVLRDPFKAQDPPLAVLAGVAVLGDAPTTDRLVAINNIRLFRVDDFTVQVQFDYEFTKPLDPNKVYTMMIQRNDLKNTKLMSTGPVVWQFKGDNAPPKGEVNKRATGVEFGNGKNYRVWAASGKDQFDVATKESKLYVAKFGMDVAEGKDVVFSNVKVELIAADKVRVSADYEFLKGPDPKKKYTVNVQRASSFKPGDLFNPVVREDMGDKWQKKGQVKGELQVQGKGDEFRVWMVATPGFLTSSNNVLVKAGGGAAVDPGGNDQIQITAVKLNSFGKKGSVVEVSYKFTGGAMPAAKATYAFILAPKGGNTVTFFQTGGAKMAAEGTFPFPTQFVLGNEREIEVYIVEASAQNRVVSNKKMVEFKKK